MILLFLSKTFVWCVGERKFHSVIPFAIASMALGIMAMCIDESPSVAFAALLMATILWGPAGKHPLRK